MNTQKIWNASNSCKGRLITYWKWRISNGSNAPSGIGARIEIKIHNISMHGQIKGGTLIILEKLKVKMALFRHSQKTLEGLLLSIFRSFSLL
jgi:hypothetical protein